MITKSFSQFTTITPRARKSRLPSFLWRRWLAWLVVIGVAFLSGAVAGGVYMSHWIHERTQPQPPDTGNSPSNMR